MFQFCVLLFVGFVLNTCVALGWGQFMVFHSILLLKFPLANSLLSFTPILSFTLSLSLSLSAELSFFSHSLSLSFSLSLSGTLFLASFVWIVRCEPLTKSSRSFLCAAIESIALLTSCSASFWVADRFESSRVAWQVVHWKLQREKLVCICELMRNRSIWQQCASAALAWPRAGRGRLPCRLLGLCATPTACQVATLVWHTALRGFQSAVYVG